MQRGERVTVVDYKGNKLTRRIVDVIGEVVLVCKPEEYQIAKQKRRLPWCVGFKKKFIVS